MTIVPVELYRPQGRLDKVHRSASSIQNEQLQLKRKQTSNFPIGTGPSSAPACISTSSACIAIFSDNRDTKLAGGGTLPIASSLQKTAKIHLDRQRGQPQCRGAVVLVVLN